MTALQLRLDGGADLAPAVIALRRAPSTMAHRTIAAHLRIFPTITSAQAGVIVHANRGLRPGNARGCDRPARYRGTGCCPAAASDGQRACERLAARNELISAGPALWASTVDSGAPHGS